MSAEQNACVEVTQADKDRAAWALDTCPDGMTWEKLTASHVHIDKKWQANRVALAFARHRIAAMDEARAERWLTIDNATPREYHDCIIACREGQEDSVGPVWWRNGCWQMADGEVWKEGWLTHWQPIPCPPERKV